MAKIFKTKASVSTSEEFQAMQEMVANYWGEPEYEKVFVIPYWKAKQLVAQVVNICMVKRRYYLTDQGGNRG